MSSSGYPLSSSYGLNLGISFRRVELSGSLERELYKWGTSFAARYYLASAQKRIVPFGFARIGYYRDEIRIFNAHSRWLHAHIGAGMRSYLSERIFFETQFGFGYSAILDTDWHRLFQQVGLPGIHWFLGAGYSIPIQGGTDTFTNPTILGEPIKKMQRLSISAHAMSYTGFTGPLGFNGIHAGLGWSVSPHLSIELRAAYLTEPSVQANGSRFAKLMALARYNPSASARLKYFALLGPTYTGKSLSYNWIVTNGLGASAGQGLSYDITRWVTLEAAMMLTMHQGFANLGGFQNEWEVLAGLRLRPWLFGK